VLPASTSESYGGHYMPTLAEAIVDDGTVANFKGFLVGNPITWLTYRNYGMYGTYYGHQLLPKPLWDEYLSAGCRNASGLDPGPVCNNITGRMDKLTAHLDPYGLDFPKCNGGPLSSSNLGNGGRHERWTLARAIRGRKPATTSPYPYFPSDYEPCTSDWAIDYLSRKDVQAALHALPGGPTWTGNWTACADIDYSQEDVAAPMMPVYQRLLKKASLRMTIMSGDDDSVCATLGTQQFIWDLGLPIKRAWAPWFMDDGPGCPEGPACNQVAGYAVSYEGLSLVTVHGGGHLVPATRPTQGFEVLKRFLNGTI
jgi:serine carboxypeptidase-like clade 2